jgi:hypothetical protein
MKLIIESSTVPAIFRFSIGKVVITRIHMADEAPIFETMCNDWEKGLIMDFDIEQRNNC